MLKGDLWGRYYANPSADEVLSGRCILVAAYDNEYSSQITSELLHIYKFDRGYLELESPEWRRIFANYNKYFSQEFILNADFANSIQDEWEDISCSANRMLAVILREDFSIDRGLLNPDDCRRIHPWVKRVEDTLGRVEEAMTESGCDKIYLCTQFSETVELFTERFGSENVIYDKSPKESFLLYEKELIRKSRDGTEFADIYDEYQNNPNQRIEKYDIYLKTMYLAAKCDSMIGQQCGGTRLALALNGGCYSYYSMIPNEKEVKLVR